MTEVKRIDRVVDLASFVATLAARVEYSVWSPDMSQIATDCMLLEPSADYVQVFGDIDSEMAMI